MSWSTADEAQKVPDDMVDLIRIVVGRFHGELRSSVTWGAV